MKIQIYSSRTVSILFLATAILTILSYKFLDQPISLFVFKYLRQDIFKFLTHIPDVMIYLSVIMFLLCVLGRQFPSLKTAAILSCVSLIANSLVKSFLKYCFGRTWPETWINNNPSFIRDNIYGFNFFHGGHEYASFPSGHTSATLTVFTILWFCLPRYRIIYGLISSALLISMVAANYHFLSDVIAGAFLGFFMSWSVIKLACSPSLSKELYS